MNVAVHRAEWRIEEGVPVHPLGEAALLVRKAQPEKVLAELGDVHGKIIRSSLSSEAEQKLQAALSRLHGTAAPADAAPATGNQGGLGQPA